MGGEEFAGLLPDTTRPDAIWLAERLRAAFAATCHTAAERPITATVSVGVATSDDASFDLSALLTAADQALYRAKALGRNRVAVWTQSPQSPSARQASGQAAA
jgi:diguanylate cyclase (GGDEF)-like protein